MSFVIIILSKLFSINSSEEPLTNIIKSQMIMKAVKRTPLLICKISHLVKNNSREIFTAYNNDYQTLILSLNKYSNNYETSTFTNKEELINNIINILNLLNNKIPYCLKIKKQYDLKNKLINYFYKNIVVDHSSSLQKFPKLKFNNLDSKKSLKKAYNIKIIFSNKILSIGSSILNGIQKIKKLFGINMINISYLVRIFFNKNFQY
ncbi:hypothetical protein CDSE_0533 [Candidatus Kinetoplastibacterium desouzaii TCC079E]|uniref:Uncharacterized protein n=1 Tax=Candidatus Kinetoplastidibacterium desouzai TCC079E TaxID=1208919 RepID=M1LM94_9PROT|nr:hypothetical protein [Candidatus Kinetoplastibacterium desouzaii]AGF46842.1 hypothetical protein CDSE_0533 [Candidatus Kinetoplastibacterium desouzaii TCC079E]